LQGQLLANSIIRRRSFPLSVFTIHPFACMMGTSFAIVVWAACFLVTIGGFFMMGASFAFAFITPTAFFAIKGWDSEKVLVGARWIGFCQNGYGVCPKCILNLLKAYRLSHEHNS
jgi:hypothetical protein